MYVVNYIFIGGKLEVILKVTTLLPTVLRVFSSVLQKDPGNTSEKGRKQYIIFYMIFFLNEWPGWVTA